MYYSHPDSVATSSNTDEGNLFSIIICYARGYNRQVIDLLPRLVIACIVTAYTEDYTSYSEAL